MPHIKLKENQPGIVGLMMQYPNIAFPMNQLAETLLVDDNSLTRAERELIAATVSFLNGCNFCHKSHAAAQAALYGNYDQIDAMLNCFGNNKAAYNQNLISEIGEKLYYLLLIAEDCTKNVRVNPSTISLAKNAGATDDEINTTIAITAAFNMFNRWVDGLSTESPEEREAYTQMGIMLANVGYANAIKTIKKAEPVTA